MKPLINIALDVGALDVGALDVALNTYFSMNSYEQWSDRQGP